MRPYFATQSIPTLLFAGSMLVWLAFEVRQALVRRADATSADRGSLLVIRVVVGVAIISAAFATARVPGAAIPLPALALAIGLVLMWCGILLRIWSFRTLGRYFTFTVMTSANQRVVASGPYRFVRHPSYLGMILVLSGLGAMYGNWLSLAALSLMPLIGFINRIHVEEAALSATLGSGYTTYASGRKRLVPYVW